jgi:type IV pilus assembly protein PilM
MAAVQPGVWGIDLGQCGLKALRVEMIDGNVTATAFDYVEHPKILSQPDADPDQLTREALEKFLSRNSIRGDTVVVSIPGQSGLARFVKLPPVEEKKIPDIVRFEAKQQIPFNLEEVVWDYQKLGSGVVTDGFAMETEIGLFAIKRDTVTRYLQHFKDVNVEVHIVQMAPLALCNYVSYDLIESTEAAESGTGKRQCIVALDIGTDSSNLVITDGQRIIWQRPIPLGGNHFTRALTKDMKLTFAKAEHLKRNATKSPDLKQILSSLKPVLNDFVGEVQRSLGYFTNTHRDANVQYMVGLGSAFRLPGLQKFISEKLQLDVRRLQKLERLVGDEVINAPTFTENVLSFAVAYGLALQGLKVARLHTNLLPQDIRIERMIRAKKPWAVVAAASLLLGTCALAIGYGQQHRAVASDQVKDAMKGGDAVLAKNVAFGTKVKSKQDEIEKGKNAVRSIIIGQEERRNWMLFNQFVNEALPRPDGSNLTEDAKKLFWTAGAQEAFKRFDLQQKGGKSADRVDEESWRDNLIQANVESVFGVFCDDLTAYHAKLMNDKTVEKPTMDEDDQKTPPTGRGWLVEVRGYTWHKDKVKFITKAVVANFGKLARQARAAEVAAATPAASQTDNKAPAPKPAVVDVDQKTSAPAVNEPMAHPIWNRVSHAVLYKYDDEINPDPLQFKLINSSHIAAFAVGGASAAPSGPGGGGRFAGGEGGGEGAVGRGGSGRSWQPLGGTGGSGGTANPMVGGRGEGIGRQMVEARMGRPNIGPGAGIGLRPAQTTATPAPTDATATTKRKKHERTEFIIFFVWREPIPSDGLLGTREGGAAGATGADAGVGLNFSLGGK